MSAVSNQNTLFVRVDRKPLDETKPHSSAVITKKVTQKKDQIKADVKNKTNLK